MKKDGPCDSLPSDEIRAIEQWERLPDPNAEEVDRLAAEVDRLRGELAAAKAEAAEERDHCRILRKEWLARRRAAKGEGAMKADRRTVVAWAVVWLGFGAMGLLLIIEIVLAWPVSAFVLGAMAFASSLAWAMNHLMPGGHRSDEG